MKAARSSRRAIRIVSQCATPDEFVAAFHPYLDRDALFIATGSPEEPGQAVRFVMTLAGGETVLRGSGRVLESHRDRGNFYGLRGMKLQFDELDDGSRRALAALEKRAGGRAHGAGAAGTAPLRPPDVLECLIYDDPDTDSSDPGAQGNRRRPARPSAERGLPPGDDDVTAVAQAPRPPPRSSAGRGTGPAPRIGHGAEPRPYRASGSVPVHMAQGYSAPLPPPPLGPDPAGHEGGMSFIVPRPRSEEEGPEIGAGASDSLPQAAGVRPDATPPRDRSRPEDHAGPGVMADRDTGRHGPWPSPPPQASGTLERVEMQADLRQSRPPQPGAPAAQVPLTRSGPVPAPHAAHPPPPDLAGFDFASLPATRPGGRRGIPRPPMPAERTQLVRFRPSYVRVAAVSATLGALLGLGAGYLLWGLDHFALPGSGSGDAADEADEVGTGEARPRPAAVIPAATPVGAPAEAAVSPTVGEGSGTAEAREATSAVSAAASSSEEALAGADAGAGERPGGAAEP